MKPTFTCRGDYLNYFKEIEKEIRKAPPHKELRTTKEKAEKFAEKNYKKRSPEVSKYPNPLPDEFKSIKIPQEINIDKKELREKIIGTILGQAVGDAVGLATEFLDKEMTRAFYNGEHISYDHFLIDRHRSRWMNEEFKCADWTDDSDQCLLILDSIVRNNGEVDEKDFAQRLYYWLGFGFTEVGDISPLGVGAHVHEVTHTKGWLKDPIEISKKVWENGGKRSAPNGSVMRTSVASIPYFWNEQKVVENARKYGLVTHYDDRCQACVTVIVLILSKLLQGRTDIINIIEESVSVAEKDLIGENHLQDFYKFVYARNLDELELNKSIGYCFKPVGCTIWALEKAQRLLREGKERKEIFESLMEQIVYEAGDADTNGCVVGAVLGCYLKPQSIPKEWLAFDNKLWLQERINRLLKLYELEPFEIDSL